MLGIVLEAGYMLVNKIDIVPAFVGHKDCKFFDKCHVLYLSSS